MHPIRRATAALVTVTGLYAAAAWIIGPTRLADWFTTLTAIDHWHPNWPDPATVSATSHTLAQLALYFCLGGIATYVALAALGPRLASGTAAAVPTGSARAIGGQALASIAGIRPTRERFHSQLFDALRDAGIAPTQALEATDTAMALADTDDPAHWAGRVRAEAMNLAGLHGRFLRIHSREAHLDETARFLTNYGYPALRVTHVGRTGEGDGHEMNFEGLAVQHATDARDAEEALIELLITAHQAHLASMADNGSSSTIGKVERYAEALRHVTTKLALRGFVPPELDAEVGRDGIATADELEQWAIAQVVAACSPMTRMPLPTIERTLGGDQ